MSETFAVAILAGGASSRFGAEKSLTEIGGAPMIAHVARALRGGASGSAVAGTPAAAARIAAVHLADPPGAVAGPLAGVWAALRWARELGVDWLVTAPCDTPLLPADLAPKLMEAARAARAPAAFACTEDGLHPLCAAWRPALAARVEKMFEQGVHASVRELAPDAATMMFADAGAFLNVNTPEDFARAAARLAQRSG